VRAQLTQHPARPFIPHVLQLPREEKKVFNKRHGEKKKLLHDLLMDEVWSLNSNSELTRKICFFLA
jgi:hypothetical protein